MRRRYLCLAGLIGLTTASAFGQGIDPVGTMHEFEAQNPGASLFFDDVSGRIARVWGRWFSEGQSPEESAFNFLHQYRDMFGDVGDLRLWHPSGEPVIPSYWLSDENRFKFYVVSVGQYVEGVPVFRGEARLRIRNEANFPLVSVSSNALIDLGGWRPQIGNQGEAGLNAGLPDAEVSTRMLRRARRTAGAGADVEGEPELVVWAGVDGMPDEPRLAVVFTTVNGTPSDGDAYDKRLFVADAQTGAILYQESQILHVDIVGTTSGLATQNEVPDNCAAEESERLQYVRVSVQGGNTAFASVNGDFVVPHAGNTPVNVTASLNGQYFSVRDQAAGGANPTVTLNVTPPGPADFLFNPSNTEFLLANVNAYWHANIVRDTLLVYEPSFPTIANQTGFIVNTNLAQTCNAFYDGSSINFYRRGGGCSNTANATVVYHEYGHHIVNRAGSGQGAFGEGYSDGTAIVILDDPCLGPGFFDGQCTNCLRTGDNTCQYSAGSCTTNCGSAAHDCGRLYSGCVWSTRNELFATEPADYLELLRQMHFSAVLDHTGSSITPQIALDWVAVDDDDADPTNGSPHYREIDRGFGAHNMPLPPLPGLQFEYPNGRPDFLNPGGQTILVEVISNSEDPQAGTGILHLDSGSGFQQIPMNEVQANLYEAEFPADACGTSVRYYFSAEDTGGGQWTDPLNAPNSSFSAIYAVGITTAFEDNFNTDQGWTVQNVDLADGGWTRGIPLNCGRGDPPSDSNDAGSFAWVTDNDCAGGGNSDVDGGPTRLISPVFNLNASSDYIVSYQRWFTNDDQDIDRLTVEVSNNGGASWTLVESVAGNSSGAWIARSFNLADYVAPSNQVRLRFNATDNPNDSVTEAGVDDFRIEEVVCDPAETDLTGVQVVVGTYSSGDLNSLLASDNNHYRFRSGFGSTLIDLHNGTLDVFATTTAGSPSTIDLTLEHRISEAAGQASVALFNWNTGQYVTVGNFAISSADQVNSVNGIAAANYVDGSGDLIVRQKYIVIVPFVAFNFDIFVDETRVTVN